MSMVMVKCPQTGRAIPTGIKTDRDSFVRIPIDSGRVFRREAGHRSDLKPATIPK